MTALAADRNTPRREGVDYSDPVAATTVIFAGGIVVLDSSGNAAPGTTATGLVPRGVAQEQVDNNPGAAGDKNVLSRKGVFRFVNGASIDRTDIGGTAYIVDDQTVHSTDGTGTRSALGTIVDVDADGVWVEIS